MATLSNGPGAELLLRPHCLVAGDGTVSQANHPWIDLFKGTASDTVRDGVSVLSDCLSLLTFPDARDAWLLAAALGFMSFPCELMRGRSLGTKSQILLIPGRHPDSGLAVIFPLGVTDGLGLVAPEVPPDNPTETLAPQGGGTQMLDPPVAVQELLTPREVQIITLLAKGCSGPGIAKHLSISESTVQAHVQNAMRKTGSHTRTGLVAIAMSEGVIKF